MENEVEKEISKRSSVRERGNKICQIQWLKKEREKAEMKKLEILKENLTAAIETKKNIYKNQWTERDLNGNRKRERRD